VDLDLKTSRVRRGDTFLHLRERDRLRGIDPTGLWVIAVRLEEERGRRAEGAVGEALDAADAQPLVLAALIAIGFSGLPGRERKAQVHPER